MVINNNIELLFVDKDKEYLNTVKTILEERKRLSGEYIHLVHATDEAVELLKAHIHIEMIVLHTETDVTSIRRTLTRLRRISLAQIQVIADLRMEDEIAEVYDYGADMWVAPIYQPELAVSYYEAFYRRQRLLPGTNSMSKGEQLRECTKMQCGALSIDPARHKVFRDGTEIHLTAREFDLLYFLAQNEGIVFAQEMLFDRLWGSSIHFHSDLSSRIARLRRKIEPNPRHPTYIRTKRGAGYCFYSK